MTAWVKPLGTHVGLRDRSLVDWLSDEGLEGASREPDTSRSFCQMNRAASQSGGRSRQKPANQELRATTGRSQPAGNSAGTGQDGSGRKSVQVPSNGNSPASISLITRWPSARTAASSGTQ
jgi:hypothetical protein